MLDPVMKKTPMRKFMMYLPDPTIEKIKAIANGRSVAEVIRMAVDEFLTKYDKDAPR